MTSDKVDIRKRESATTPNPSSNDFLKKEKNNRNVEDYTSKGLGSTLRQLLYVLAVVLIFLWVFQSNFGTVDSHSHSHGEHGHAHDHDHHHDEHEPVENPAYRYSRAANEKAVRTLKDKLYYSACSIRFDLGHRKLL